MDLINELRSYGAEVFVHDPVPAQDAAREEYGITLLSWEELPVADAMVVAVAHTDFLTRTWKPWPPRSGPGGVRRREGAIRCRGTFGMRAFGLAAIMVR